jgi:CHAT domain-containing protein
LYRIPLLDYGAMIFATHGYFGNKLPGIQEPVLVLTLLDQPEGQDGFLRVSEVIGLRLNAEIVALTACQTGLGQRISGEGTMCMGRAFQYAGARCALMSLWSVEVNASISLAQKFFKHLTSGKSKLQALKLAREEIRKTSYNHPFFWASFILAGEVD